MSASPVLIRTLRSIAPVPASVMALLLALPGSAMAQDAAPSPSTAASADPTSAASVMPLPPELGTPLEPGRYVDTTLGREISLDLGEGWTSQGSAPEAGFAIIADPELGPYIATASFGGEVFTEPCATAEDNVALDADPTLVETTPEAFVNHLAAHPYLTVTGNPIAVEVGGLSGLQVDAIADVPDDCDPPWAWLWVLPVYGDYHLSDEAQGRFIALDGGDQLIVVVVETLAEPESDPLIETAMTVLDSMEIGEAG